MTRHDSALTDAEWRDFVADRDFGQLVASGRGRDVPIVVPSHYVFDGRATVELHLHRDNPVWLALAQNPRALFAVIDAHVYVPTGWNADPGMPAKWSPPTSYYAAVQLVGDATVVDTERELAALLERQMSRMQPEGGHAPITPGPSPYGRMLRGIRGLRLVVSEVRAKFKFGGNKGYEHQGMIAERLAERGTELDRRARQHLLRRRAKRSPTRFTSG